MPQRTDSPFALGVAQRTATRVAFFVCGFGIAAWAPLIPYAKARLNVDDGSLGLLLFCLGGGSMVTMPAVGILAGRFGCRPVILWAGFLMCAALPFLATLASIPAMAVALAIFGAGVGAIDVGVNIQSVVVETAAGRPMMSGFHGLYSVGGIAGAVGMSGLLLLGLSPVASTLVVVAIVVALLAAFGRHLSGRVDGAAAGPAFAWPRGMVLWLGVLCFIMFLAEGSVLDWAAVFLTTVRGVAKTNAGVGYAAFAAAMTVGRLNGDRIVHALGAPTILRLGGITAATGFALASLLPWWPAALVGFALVGLGASNIVPVLTSTAGRQTAVPAGVAIATITSIGYVGILSGPAAIGLVAHLFGLPIALLAVAAAVLGVAASGGVARRSDGPSGVQ